MDGFGVLPPPAVSPTTPDKPANMPSQAIRVDYGDRGGARIQRSQARGTLASQTVSPQFSPAPTLNHPASTLILRHARRAEENGASTC